MALIKISTDGTAFEVRDELARNDQELREALKPFYPEMANAEITRTEKNGKLVVEMVKRAGTKGSRTDQVLAALCHLPEQLNPALVMQHRLNQLEAQNRLDLQTLLRLQPQIRRAVGHGSEDIRQQKKSLDLLKAGIPQPAKTIPRGF
jgi:hypothetical protein